MAGKTYTEVLEEIYNAIRNGTNGTLKVIISNQEDAIRDRQEIKDDIKLVRDAVQANGIQIGILDQWKELHMSETHGAITKEVDRLDGRVTRWVVGNVSLTAALAAAGQAIREVFARLVP